MSAERGPEDGSDLDQMTDAEWQAIRLIYGDIAYEQCALWRTLLNTIATRVQYERDSYGRLKVSRA